MQSFAKDKEVEISYSGGKDSDVILELAKMAGINYRAIYKNTTIDPPKTIAHCKSKGVEVIQPKERFLEIISKRGFPNRFRRFCCGILKEYKVLDYAVQGIRRCESTKRASRYTEPQICRFYGSKKNHVSVLLPILEWTDEDVAEFITERGVECHPLYYDERGGFHVERRLGCIGCPLAAGWKRREQFKQYPNMVKAWINAMQKYMDTHPDARAHLFGNAINNFYAELFCERSPVQGFKEKMRPDLWGNVFDPKKYQEDYFNIKL